MFETFITATVFLLIFAFSYAGVEAFRRWSLRREIFDVPNERSSHTAPTPRGGGIVVVVLSLLAYTVYTVFVTGTFAWGYAAGALMIALVSWLDDLRSISFVWRFAVHAAAALLIVFSVGYFAEIYLPIVGQTPRSACGGMFLTFLWLVWLTNAYNFMDGIDGIAGMQCVTAGIGWLLVGNVLQIETVGFYGGALASAGAGFLIQNWQPAKIFMGDVGSAFLGYTFAALPLLAVRETAANADVRKILPLLAVAFTWLFVFDTVRTIIKRIFRKEKIWEAHRGHIYQQLIINGYSHQSIALLYGGLSALAAAAAIWWASEREISEAVLVLVLGLQAIGLLLAVKGTRNRRI